MKDYEQKELDRIKSMKWHFGDGCCDKAIMLDDGAEIIGSSEWFIYDAGVPEYICELHNKNLEIMHGGAK